jgi:predicted aspartyl protease
VVRRSYIASAYFDGPNGTKRFVPTPVALTLRGPLIPISVSPTGETIELVKQRDQPVPNTVQLVGLIDTGADFTSIDDDVAKKAGFPVIDTRLSKSASDRGAESNAYPPICITLSDIGRRFNVNRPHGSKLVGFDAIIGRDILQHMVVVYNGITGKFTIFYNPTDEIVVTETDLSYLRYANDAR